MGQLERDRLRGDDSVLRGHPTWGHPAWEHSASFESFRIVQSHSLRQCGGPGEERPDARSPAATLPSPRLLAPARRGDRSRPARGVQPSPSSRVSERLPSVWTGPRRPTTRRPGRGSGDVIAGEVGSMLRLARVVPRCRLPATDRNGSQRTAGQHRRSDRTNVAQLTATAGDYVRQARMARRVARRCRERVQLLSGHTN